MASEYGRKAALTGAALTTRPLLVKFSKRLGAPQREVFDYVTDISRLHEWIPLAQKSWSDDSNAEEPGRVGAVRVIVAGPGKPTREVIKFFEEPNLLAYSASDDSLFGLATDHLSVISVEPHPSGGSVMTWLAYGRPADSLIKRGAAQLVFRTALGGGMRNLGKKFPT
ncbi:MAG: SRPBCC family protein [Polyangiales bacterium]